MKGNQYRLLLTGVLLLSAITLSGCKNKASSYYKDENVRWNEKAPPEGMFEQRNAELEAKRIREIEAKLLRDEARMASGYVPIDEPRDRR